MTNCTHEILVGRGFKVGQVKSVVIKKIFSRGVTLVCTHKILTGEGVFLVKSNL